MARSQLEPESPEWWVAVLSKDLDARTPDIVKYQDYYDGKQRLAFATPKFRSAFGDLFKEFADNWCELVVDAVEERLNVEGFRIPQPAPADDGGERGEERETTQGDQDAWEMWQRNGLDADSQIAHTEALIAGESFALTWPDDDGEPGITIESPLEMAAAYEPGTRTVAAALKRFGDPISERAFATLYLPDGIWKFQTARKWSAGGRIMWVPRELEDELRPMPNPLGVVPVVALANRPRLLKPGVSELKPVVPLQDAVNKLVADMMVASEFGAARQRWATGLEVPKDPETGQEIKEAFSYMFNRFWHSESEGTKFGEFDSTDLTNFVSGIEMMVQHIASQTRTPPHYFYLKGTFPSGEAIKSAETGLVAKSKRKMRHFGEGWEAVIRHAFLVKGDARAKVMTSETIWGDPESRSEAEHIDAVVKKAALGVPVEQLWEDAGYSPQQIARFKAMLREQALEGDSLLAAVASLNSDVPPGGEE